MLATTSSQVPLHLLHLIRQSPKRRLSKVMYQHIALHWLPACRLLLYSGRPLPSCFHHQFLHHWQIPVLSLQAVWPPCIHCSSKVKPPFPGRYPSLQLEVPMTDVWPRPFYTELKNPAPLERQGVAPTHESVDVAIRSITPSSQTKVRAVVPKLAILRKKSALQSYFCPLQCVWISFHFFAFITLESQVRHSANLSGNYDEGYPQAIRIHDLSTFVEALTHHNLAQWVTISSSDPTAVWKQMDHQIQSHCSDNNLRYTFQNINQNTTPPPDLYGSTSAHDSRAYNALPWEFMVPGSKPRNHTTGRLINRAELAHHMVTCDEVKKLAAKLIHPVYPHTGVIIVGRLFFHKSHFSFKSHGDFYHSSQVEKSLWAGPQVSWKNS